MSIVKVKVREGCCWLGGAEDARSWVHSLGGQSVCQEALALPCCPPPGAPARLWDLRHALRLSHVLLPPRVGL